ncbi:hypothetical protein DLM78_22470 [Leptospira stimsonii]|uniref:Uncharacterized protein n=1 Tax=Leptospira stimsonii TaxID=2202203 RepID=A0A8B3CIM6_9LEPT|nr:hypothetical protein DLM78_22470 [Leptospira stimsonii]
MELSTAKCMIDIPMKSYFKTSQLLGVSIGLWNKRSSTKKVPIKRNSKSNKKLKFLNFYPNWNSEVNRKTFE